jgi:signal recognition particle subunit SRP54
MGDILSLVEQAQEKVDHEKAAKLARKVKRGKGFDLEDLRDQFTQMENMGGLGNLMDKLPGMGSGVAQAMQNPAHSRQMKGMVAIIDSMTPLERRKPEVINGSRKRRVAQGSGTQIQDVNRLLKQHKQMQRMMKKMGSKGGMANMLRGMKGRLPPGMPF